MRKEINQILFHNPRLNYRGMDPSRIDNLTDAVFGVAITLLIFNLADPNSFSDLLTIAKTFPAFLIGVGFLALVYSEHLLFSKIYTLHDGVVKLLNIIFIALVIFYVYPLRFLTVFLTNFFFQDGISITITDEQVPSLMIYYGFLVFALYFVLYLFYARALKIKDKLQLSNYEEKYTKLGKVKMIIMFSVPLLSILLVAIIRPFSYALASFIGGMVYFLYWPAMMIWGRWYNKSVKNIPAE